MSLYGNLEETVEKTGREIYSLIGKEIPSLLDSARWKGKLMEWAMKDDAFKVRMFRFIDVLPALKDDSLLVNLFNEYFADLQDNPMIVQRGIAGISKRGILPAIAGRVIRSRVEALAKQFIAGSDPEDSFSALNKLNEEGLTLSVDLLGEAVLSDSEAEEYIEKNLKLLDSLGDLTGGWEPVPLLHSDDQGPIPRWDLSVKVSSFYAHLDPIDWYGSITNVSEALRPVIEKAMEVHASLTLDMESYQHKDLTIAILRHVLREYDNLACCGIAIQAYLRDSMDDILGIIDYAKETGKRVTVRLVKGAYWDYETVTNRQRGWPVPVFLNKAETDLNFEELTKTLMGNTRYVRPAIASHNVRSISHAIGVAKVLKLPRNAFEFQNIYGMAEPVRSALVKMGYRVRVYTPIGELIPGIAYLIRRLLENTSNESFLRKSFSEETPIYVLIKAPEIPESSPADPCADKGFRNEPPTDFSQADNREKMKAALQTVRKNFDAEYPLIIGDSEIRNKDHIVSTNPARPEEVIGRVCRATSDDADKAVEEARKAWTTWRKTSVEDRADYLFKAAARMRDARFDLAALQVYEIGKTWREADGDIAEATDFLEYYGNEMLSLGVPRHLGSLAGESNLYFHEPRGVGAVIAPWNFPLAISTGMVSAGIVSGNCIIYKPSGLSVVTGWKLMEIFRAVGLPPGVLQFLPGPGESVGEHLVSHPGVDFVAFTGSKEVGLKIVELAAVTSIGQRNVKRVIAEMGGKNAIIVDETADLDEAVKGVLESALGFQGQKCSACSRAIVVRQAYEDFAHRLKEAMQSVPIGPPEDPAVAMGPVVDNSALKKINNYVEIGSREGTTVLRRTVEGPGYFVGPVMITDVSPDSTIAQEEVFGPVLVVLKAEDIDEALEIANDTEYALTGGIYSRSPRNIAKVHEEFRVGNLYINRKITGALVGRQPFGGFGMSGVGSKSGGPDYLTHFTHVRCVSENTLRRGFAPEV
jgi:RHH-type proline utilization regulon transcriptional repressor/proline dehydrogenase/delta 1-pyrroline-5-carboxylate dehydrogenase